MVRFKYNLITLAGMFLFHFILAGTAFSTTYFIDYENGADTNEGTTTLSPWKHCPGMVGFAGSHAHKAGDTFIFKGGVTWPSTTLPLKIANSGASISCNLTNETSTCDKYTVDHAWHTGSSWSRPTFDGGHTKSGIYGARGKAQYIIIDNIKIVNLRTCNKTTCDSVAAVLLVEPHYAEVKNMYIDAGSKLGIQLADSSTDDKSTILIHDNYIVNCFKQLFFDGSGHKGRRKGKINNLQIYNNHFAGNNVLAGGGSHSNVIHIFGGVTTAPFPFTNMKIYNNLIDGAYPYGFTAFIYIERAADGVDIYNNVLNFDNTNNVTCGTTHYCNGIEFWSGNNVRVYNNTVSSIGTNKGGNTGIHWGYVHVTAPSNVTVKGNIFNNLAVGIGCHKVVNCIVDFNLAYPRSGGYYGENQTGKKRSTFSAWQSDGYDVHGLSDNPLFVNSSKPPYDLNILPSSPAIKAFPIKHAPTDTFTTDVRGKSRMEGSSWDIGAFQRSP